MVEFKIALEYWYAKRHVVNKAMAPPLGFSKQNSPAEILEGSS
jgi:hypothetical protein